MVLHFLIEGQRWQMVPAYILAVLLGVLTLLPSPSAPKTAWWRVAARITGAFACLAMFGLTCLLATGAPIFTYPKPSGPYGVGTTRLFFVDRSREDPFSPAPHTPRELLTAVWYPAEVVPGAKPDPFWPPDADAQQGSGLPKFLTSHLHLVPSHSYSGAPLAKAEPRYPVLIFSHGYDSTIWQNVPQMEELASHGFIVVSLAHTYDSSSVKFPDGRVIASNSMTRNPSLKREAWAKLADYSKRMEEEAENPAEIRRIWKESQEYQRQVGIPFVTSVVPWLDDTRFLMDQLAAINAGTAQGVVGEFKTFTGRMDLDRLGVFGMSFGGSTAGLVCSKDARCKAGLNFDGWQFGDLTADPLHVPFMFFSNQTAAAVAGYYESKADLYSVHVKRSTHGNFSDFSLIFPILTWTSSPRFAYLGRIDGAEMERIMSAYSLAFFRQYLQGKPQPLLQSSPPPGEFPDVVFTAQRAAAEVNQPAVSRARP
jgi:predicted dienelactone hydrolase